LICLKQISTEKREKSITLLGNFKSLSLLLLGLVFVFIKFSENYFTFLK